MSVRSSPPNNVIRVGVLYPTDPAGHVPSGIDSFIRGLLKWVPSDIEYTLFGASSDPIARPVGKPAVVQLGGRSVSYMPIVTVDPTGSRKPLPLTVRYVRALRKYALTSAMRRCDLLDFHRIEPVSLFTRDTRRKNLFTHHDMAVLRDPNSDIRWRHAPRLYDMIERRLLRHVDRVFCVRQTAVKRYSATYPEVARKFVFMPTYVDTSVFYPCEAAGESRNHLRDVTRDELDIPRSAKILISVGRLDYQKDPLLLVDAFSRAVCRDPTLYLLIIGDGILRGAVRSKCDSPELKGHVRLLGARPAQEIARLLQASDLFVMTSAYEGMPFALLEALATGTPVVTTDVGEARLVVHENVNGYFAPERTSEAVCHTIRRALDNADSLRGRPCVTAVEPYQPERVLARVYDNHRRQTKELMQTTFFPMN